MGLKKNNLRLETLFSHQKYPTPDPSEFITRNPSPPTGILSLFHTKLIEINSDDKITSPANLLLYLCRQETRPDQVIVGLSEIYRQNLVHLNKHETTASESKLLNEIDSICNQHSFSLQEIQKIAIFSTFFPDTIERQPLSYAINVSNNLNINQNIFLPDNIILTPNIINVILMESMVHRLGQSSLIDPRCSLQKQLNDNQIKYLAANTDSHYRQATILHAIAHITNISNAESLLNQAKRQLNYSKAGDSLIKNQNIKIQTYAQRMGITIDTNKNTSTDINTMTL
ncbi:MAG: hypothetical protein WC069_01640 [Candidatus Shapirobacteria bacterium]